MQCWKRGTGGDNGAVGTHYVQYQKDRASARISALQADGVALIEFKKKWMHAVCGVIAAQNEWMQRMKKCVNEFKAQWMSATQEWI